MSAKTIANGILRAIAILAGIVILGWFFYKIQSVIVYLAIAAVIALLGRPIVLFLRKKLKFPNTLAVIATMLFMVSIFLGILALFIPLITKQSQNLSLLDIDMLTEKINSLYLETLQYFGASTGSVNEIISESHIEESMLSDLDLGFIPDFLNTFMNALSSFSIGFFSVLFISFFFLKDRNLLQNGLLTFVPDNKESNMVKSIEKINNLLSRYFAGILLQLFILFVIYTIALLIVGVENAIVIAFLCALFNIIPYIGPIIGGVIMITLTMTSFLGADFSSVIIPKTMYVLIGLAIGQLIDNFFSQPFIFSNSVKSHPLEIFLVIIIAGLLFGVVGMVVAVPGYTAIKVILKEFLAEYSVVQKLTKNL
ncbi:AI-2E family transporter [Flagellimonas zhangzhouensis]|uniref:Predicted PurR-regulated permease PerM n=1 Tax=Flagellimonas zhangzhouensis TaxID=1073328 RepID=A0A1H2YPH7_9FLAO|nr:AI-2E family transporter [Allomuricauda zhangzhouensis]SDR01010.1 Predicted PurR-regulated permease PerM [Allomuricauda zhangzhouensis]SDX06871.1 Predicted PurR-regulated permease PerM [Allomuricauda zhangzhouensis]